MITHVPHEEIDNIRNELWRPPAGEGRKVSEREMEADAASFMAFAGAFGIAPPSGS